MNRLENQIVVATRIVSNEAFKSHKPSFAKKQNAIGAIYRPSRFVGCCNRAGMSRHLLARARFRKPQAQVEGIK